MFQKIANTSTKTKLLFDKFYFLFVLLLKLFFPSSSHTHPYRKRDNSYNQTSPLSNVSQLTRIWTTFPKMRYFPSPSFLTWSWHLHRNAILRTFPKTREKYRDTKWQTKKCWNSLIFVINLLECSIKYFFYY